MAASKANKALKGLSVLVTRPEHQADGLCQLIENTGGTAIRLPLLTIKPPRDESRVRAVLGQLADYDWLLFTSINSVQGAVSLAPEDAQWPKQIASVGASTAKAVTDLGIGESIYPRDGASSEALLAHPALEEVLDKRILLIKGEGGREVLSRTLAARGARIDAVDVYRREQAEIDPDELEKIADDSDVLVVTSGESLEYLGSLTKSGRSALYSMQLVVPSQRVVQMAEELGFICTPLVPKQISDQAIVEALIAWRKK